MKHLGYISHTLFGSVNKLGYSEKELLPQPTKEAKKVTKKIKKKTDKKKVNKKTTDEDKKDV